MQGCQSYNGQCASFTKSINLVQITFFFFTIFFFVTIFSGQLMSFLTDTFLGYFLFFINIFKVVNICQNVF